MKTLLTSRVNNSFPVTLLKAVYVFIPGIIFLVAYYFIIIKISIGQDMLMQANEGPGPYIWTIISILVWMLFSWFSSRLVSDAYIIQCDLPHKKIFEHFPRLLGYNVAVCLQLAILNLPTVAVLNKGWYLLLFFLHNFFYFLLNMSFERGREDEKKKWLLIISAIIAIAYIIFLIIIFPKNTPIINATYQNTHLRGSITMTLLAFAFQVGFVAFVVWRRKKINENKIKNADVWRRSYNVFAAIVLVLYIIILESPKFADNVGAIGITLLVFGLWVGFICLLKYATIKLNVHFWLPLLALAIVYGLVWKHTYQVRLHETSKNRMYSSRPNIDSFFNRWINDSLRKNALINDSTKPYNVYLVLADGGASKSGYWVAAVLSKLEESSPAENKFSNHLFSLAGASGGSVGNAAFYSLLKNNLTNHPVNFTQESRLFFEGDFLSSTFARFLGPDLFRHIFPLIFMDDRAAVLEQAMESNSQSKSIGSYFGGSIDTVFDNKGHLPALFINTTNLQAGSPGVVSNIRLDSQVTERMDILTLIDTATALNTNRDMKLSTAVVLGARFPYLSPAGEIAGKYFVDGGYFDNSGAGITLELLQYIERKMNDATNNIYAPYKHRLAFKVIYISNGSDKSGDHDLNPLLNDMAAPLLTVLGTYGMQTNLANKKLSNFMCNTSLGTTNNPFETLNLPMKPFDADDAKVPYPMNWVISKYNLNRMENNLRKIDFNKVLE